MIKERSMRLTQQIHRQIYVKIAQNIVDLNSSKLINIQYLLSKSSYSMKKSKSQQIIIFVTLVFTVFSQVNFEKCCQTYYSSGNCRTCPEGSFVFNNNCILAITKCVKQVDCFSCAQCASGYKLVDSQFAGYNTKKCINSSLFGFNSINTVTPATNATAIKNRTKVIDDSPPLTSQKSLVQQAEVLTLQDIEGPPDNKTTLPVVEPLKPQESQQKKCCLVYDKDGTCLTCPDSTMLWNNTCIISINHCEIYEDCFSCTKCLKGYELFDSQLNGLKTNKCFNQDELLIIYNDPKSTPQQKQMYLNFVDKVKKSDPAGNLSTILANDTKNQQDLNKTTISFVNQEQLSLTDVNINKTSSTTTNTTNANTTNASNNITVIPLNVTNISVVGNSSAALGNTTNTTLTIKNTTGNVSTIPNVQTLTSQQIDKVINTLYNNATLRNAVGIDLFTLNTYKTMNILNLFIPSNRANYSIIVDLVNSVYALTNKSIQVSKPVLPTSLTLSNSTSSTTFNNSTLTTLNRTISNSSIASNVPMSWQTVPIRLVASNSLPSDLIFRMITFVYISLSEFQKDQQIQKCLKAIYDGFYSSLKDTKMIAGYKNIPLFSFIDSYRFYYDMGVAKNYYECDVSYDRLKNIPKVNGCKINVFK